MKKLFALLLVAAFVFSLSACKSDKTPENTETKISQTATLADAQLFFDNVCESKLSLDVVAAGVCTAWKQSQNISDITVEEIKSHINQSIVSNNKMVERVNTLENGIDSSFKKAKSSPASKEATAVMTAYDTYLDLVFNPKVKDTTSTDFVEITNAKSALDKALRAMRTALGS